MSLSQTDEPDPSDSAVQREIELVMLDRLGEQHPDWQRVSWKTTAAELGLPPAWQKAEPDAVWKADSGEVIVAEVYARVGELKAGHRRKLAMDALKLTALRHALPEGYPLRCLLVVPKELKGKLKGDGWFPLALGLAAEIVPVALLADELKRLGDASRLQAQGQARANRAGEDGAE
jgi:hypothetical protein